MHGLLVSCPFNFSNGNLKQQLSHIGVFICYQNIYAKNKLNLPICGIHLLNPYKTVVSHLKVIEKVNGRDCPCFCFPPLQTSEGKIVFLELQRNTGVQLYVPRFSR